MVFPSSDLWEGSKSNTHTVVFYCIHFLIIIDYLYKTMVIVIVLIRPSWSHYTTVFISLTLISVDSTQ